MNDTRPPPVETPPETVTGERLTLRHAKRGALIFVGLLLLGGLVRFGSNLQEAHALQDRTRNSLQRTVAAAYAKASPGKRAVVLPATLRGNRETVIVARSNGYVTAWYKTIGDSVKKGELLATVAAPEQDQELLQARAVREQAQVRSELAHGTLQRWEAQFKLESVSQQDLDEKRAAYKQSQADLSAARANLQRLEQLVALRRITAPFSGVITRRAIDEGNLVVAGGRELFALAETEHLRVSLWVPQTYAAEVKPGQEVKIRSGDFGAKPFTANIEHVSGAIDPINRSRQIEIIVPNEGGKLLPGAYVDVEIALQSSTSALLIPANALVVGKDGPRVFLVGEESKIAVRPVRLGRDLGKEIEVLSGITKKDLLVLNPSDQLKEDETVLAVIQQKDVKADGKGETAKPGETKSEQTKPGQTKLEEKSTDGAPTAPAKNS